MTKFTEHLFFCFLFLTTTAFAPDKLKIYISADMEGTVGAVTGEQLGPSGFEYQRFREFMTREVNAAIDLDDQRSHADKMMNQLVKNPEVLQFLVRK